MRTKQDVLKLFEEIRQGKYEPYASEDVVRELLDTSDTDKKNQHDKIDQ